MDGRPVRAASAEIRTRLLLRNAFAHHRDVGRHTLVKDIADLL